MATSIDVLMGGILSPIESNSRPFGKDNCPLLCKYYREMGVKVALEYCVTIDNEAVNSNRGFR